MTRTEPMARCRIPLLLLLPALFLLTAGCTREARKQAHIERGDAYFAEGDYRKAQIEYLNTLQLAAPEAHVLERIGTIWLENGSPARAYPYLLKAHELAPDNPAITAKVATSLVRLGEREEAQKRALEALEKDPQNGEALIALADAIKTPQDVSLTEEALWHAQGSTSAAYHLAWAQIAAARGDGGWIENEIRQALQAEPDAWRPHLALGELFLARDEVEAAEREFSTAAKSSPIRSDARLRYAKFLASRRSVEGARQYLAGLTSAAPDYVPAWMFLAELAFAEKKWDEAIAALDHVFEADFEHVQARLFESDILLAKGESARAVDYLERMAAAYPDVALINFRFARASWQNGDVERAEIALQKTLALSPDNADALLLLAQIKLQKGESAVAVSTLQRLLTKRPDLAVARDLLADALQSAGRNEEAIEVVRAQIEEAPDSAEAQQHLGALLQKAGQPGDARAAYAKARQLAPDALAPWMALVELEIAQNDFAAAQAEVEHWQQTHPRSAEAEFLLGKISFAQKDWARAETAFTAALDLDPRLTSASELLISTYVAAEQVPQATARLEKIVAQDPGNQRALSTLALLYHSSGQLEQARDTYEKLLALDSGSSAALNNLAFLYAEHFNQPEKAFELARRARVLRPTDPLVADTLGWVLYRKGRYQEALTLLQEAALKLPESADVQYHLGAVSYMMDRTDAARAAFKKAAQANGTAAGKAEAARWLAYLEDDTGAARQLSLAELEALIAQRPEDVIARVRLGEAYEKAGEHEKAAASFAKALNTNPNLVSATVRLAQIYAGPIPKPAEALALAKRARELAPGDSKVTAILGRIAFQIGQFAWAANLLQMSARDRPDDPHILYDYAWASYGMGRRSEARALMQRVLDASAAQSLKDEAQKFLTATALEENPAELPAQEPKIAQLLQADPDYLPALMVQAALQRQKGATKDALATYGAILRRYPEFAPAQKNWAELAAGDEDKLDRAYELATKARQSMPSDPAVARVLGELCFRKKQFPYALQLLQESAKARPLDATGLYYLGLASLGAQQRRDGQTALEAALAAGLAEPFASAAKTELANLKAN